MSSYSVSFGEAPANVIERSTQLDEIYDSFLRTEPACRVFVLTGVRGSGKTVCLAQLSDYFSRQSDWIAVDLTSQRDLISGLYSCLKQQMNLKLPHAEIALQALDSAILHAELLTDLFEKLKKENKKVLITIDEVSCTPSMKEFAAQFQIYIRKKYPVCQVMTGLYKNVDDLQNEDNLTFLHRARKIHLGPLNERLIAADYEKNLLVDSRTAKEMARLTSGYPYAFQSLGYILERHPELSNDQLLLQYDALLQDGVYEKLWSELPAADKKTAAAMALHQVTRVKEIREAAGMDSSQFSVPRQRLIKKGILTSPAYGYLKFVLPRFVEYIQWEWTRTNDAFASC